MLDINYVRCNSHCKHPAYTKDDVDTLLGDKTNNDNFAVVEGTIELSNTSGTAYQGNTAIPFPQGFNKDNTFVVSILYKDGTAFKRYVNGCIIGTGGVPNYIIATLGKTDGTDDNNIYIQMGGNDIVVSPQYVKLLLMKID